MKRTFLGSLVVMILVSGCTNYYKVTDPSTNKTYYTTEIKKKQGATELKDARTGSQVTVQNSEVTEIKKEEFEAGKNTAPVDPAAKPKW